ncbi:MAG: helix-turn-helix transcriptional regulator [Campylobacterota bacterium]
MSQSEFANIIGIGLRTYTRYEKEERQPDLNVLLEIHKKFDVSLDWLIAGTGSRIGLDTIFSPYFDILKNICPEDEHAEVETEILEEMIKSINTKIAKYLVSSLLKEVKDLPLFEKAKNLIIINDLGATIRIWSIVEKAARDTSDSSPKEKLITAAKKGFSLTKWLITQGERDFIAKFVESWPDESCTFILEHSDTFIEALKQLTPKASETISTNEKILAFVRRGFSKTDN